MMKTFTPFFNPLLHVGRFALHFFLPPTCVVCADVLQGERGLGFCPSCYKDLPHLPYQMKKNGILPHLPTAVDAFYAPFLYKEPLQKLVSRLKFNDTEELAKPLAHFLAVIWREQGLSANLSHHGAVMMPVPLHASRLRGRGFNQAALIARTFFAELRVEDQQKCMLDLYNLRRTKKTRTQVGQRASARKRNLSGAFEVNEPERVKGRDIILVDDVWTTGSTASACAKCLKRAGAKSVIVLTLCYVPVED